MKTEQAQRLSGDLPEGASGRRFGKYRLLKQVAVGGMAQIFLGIVDGPRGFQKHCIIKKVLPEHSRLEEFSKMFITEAKVAALLKHPHIVQVFDFGRVGDEYFIAMEWVEGASVEGLIKGANKASVPLGIRVAVQVGIPLCEALDYAHHYTLPSGQPLGLVHRDLTPGNVLISKTGVVKLADFGVVKVSLNNEQTNVGVVKGKFAYMSPEQISSLPLDRRSDIFSLGIILYELCTGRWLFRRPELGAVVAAVSETKIPPPSAVIPGFPAELQRILLKALAKKPEDRYQHARDLLTDLEAYRNAQGWSAGPRDLAGLMGQVFPELLETVAAEPEPSSWDGPSVELSPSEIELAVSDGEVVQVEAAPVEAAPVEQPPLEEPAADETFEAQPPPSDRAGWGPLEWALVLGALAGTVALWWFLLT